jgi:histidinol-phosphate aminotransferase
VNPGLRHHGDLDALPGLVDLAVNVRSGTPPRWLAERIAAADLARYPDQTRARAAVAGRHGRDVREVLLTAGAAEAFVLLARALRPRRAAVIHPQFTEPEAALLAGGYVVDRVVLDEPFRLDPRDVPGDADLVVLGNPTNPTSVLHPRDAVRALVRPGRLVVVDEAFADCVPGETESLAAEPDLAGIVVVRSLTKTWGLAGLRVGYLLAEPTLVDALRAAQPQWPVSAPALEACIACSTSDALADAAAWAVRLRDERERLAALVGGIPGVQVADGAEASFLLVRVDRPEIWNPLRDKGFAVRRGDTFPGLGPCWIRVAVRDEPTSTAFAIALKECL